MAETGAPPRPWSNLRAKAYRLPKFYLLAGKDFPNLPRATAHLDQVSLRLYGDQICIEWAQGQGYLKPSRYYSQHITVQSYTAAQTPSWTQFCILRVECVGGRLTDQDILDQGLESIDVWGAWVLAQGARERLRRAPEFQPRYEY